MAVFLRDTPIKRKLMLVILLTNCFVLLLMGTALITFELVTFRRSLATNMGVLADIIGANSTGAIAFQDARSAQGILAALSAEEQITKAAIYDHDGRIFARFPSSLSFENFPGSPSADGFRFDRAHLVLFQPVWQDGTRLGTIYLQADLSEMYSRFAVYGLLLLCVGAASSLGAIVLTTTLQQRISVPIMELARVAGSVSDLPDYSVRAVKHGNDEIGHLTDAFNRMLMRIGESNAALAASEERLRLALTESKKNEEELNRAKETAEAANKAKDNFLAILSHELRTPLTPVLATVAMLEDDQAIPAHIRSDLEMIRRNIEVEARLIDDLLDVTGIIRGKLELNRQPVDVRRLLEHAMQTYCSNAAARKKLRVSIQIIATETHVLADSSRLTQVFWNLLQNSCKFTPESGEIYVRVYNEFAGSRTAGPEHFGPDLIVEIRDTGIGISPENMPHIFNAFEQGERSRTRVFGGLGLGLAISRAIIELHDGSITAESEGRNRGAKFVIRLQAVESPAAASQGASVGGSFSAAVSSRALRILLVEDHSDTAQQLTRLLKRAGHEVTWAGTINQARSLIADSNCPDRDFNILISDLGLPDGSGHELMRDLASRGSIPGIALSGYGMKNDILDSMAAGFSRHITKPVDWQELKIAIQKIAAEHDS